MDFSPLELRNSYHPKSPITSKHNKPMAKYDYSSIELLSKIGRGGYASVYKIYHKPKSQLMALKYYNILEKEDLDQLNLENSIINELISLNNPCFLRNYGLFQDPILKKTYLLEMELGVVNMNEILQAGKIYNQEEIFYILYDFSQALASVLLEKKQEKRVFLHKLYDFGVGYKGKPGEKLIEKDSLLGFTRGYASSEVLNIVDSDRKTPNNTYNPYRSDVFSLGLTVIRMTGITNLKDFREKHEYKEGYEDLKIILEKMLKENPEERSDFHEISEFLKGFKKKKPENEEEFVEKRLKDKGNDYKEMEKNYTEVFRLKEKLYGENSEEIEGILKDLVSFYEKNKEFQKAEKFYQRSLAIKRKVFGEKYEENNGVLQENRELEIFKEFT